MACGLVAPSLEEETADVRCLIGSAEYQMALKDGAPPPLARRFVCRALITAARNEPNLAFQQMLFASWVADDDDLPELARTYRLEASRLLEKQPELDLTRKVQLLDVLRRARAWDAAKALVAELVAADLDKQLARIVAFQVTLIERRDESCYLVSDAIPPPTEPPKHKAAPPPASLLTRLRHWMGRGR